LRKDFKLFIKSPVLANEGRLKLLGFVVKERLEGGWGEERVEAGERVEGGRGAVAREMARAIEA
jgi:hypothetical protein